jgi:hypothetical protein
LRHSADVKRSSAAAINSHTWSNGPRAGRAEERFQLREGKLDGIQVRTVGRQKAQVRAGRFDRGADLGVFVNGEVVQDDDIARPSRRHEHLLDVGAERRMIDRPIEDGRGTEALEPQGGDDRVHLPMTTGGVIAKSRAAGAAPVAAQEIGGDATFVKKDKLAHVAERLPALPVASRRGDIRASLFVGVYGFF